MRRFSDNMSKKGKTYRIVFTSGRDSLVISPESECRLIAGGLAGFDIPELELTTRPLACGNGGYIQRKRFAERELSLTFDIFAEDERAQELRRLIIRMMDPNAGSGQTIYAELFGVRREIDVVPSGEARFVRDTLYDRMEVTLEFTAPEVFFRDAEAGAVQFRDPVKLFAFPLTFIKGAGTVSGIMRTAESASVYNPGDAPCGVVVTITADGGAVSCPGIRLSDGEFIKCPVTLADGEWITIDTRERHKNIIKNGERYFAFDRKSSFFSLPCGRSAVQVTCDSGGEYISATMRYVPLYFGC